MIEPGDASTDDAIKTEDVVDQLSRAVHVYRLAYRHLYRHVYGYVYTRVYTLVKLVKLSYLSKINIRHGATLGHY